MTKQARVLIISFSALSKEGANGRTLECLVNSLDSDHLAQLFMSEEQPDYTVCNKYFQITDNQVLTSFFKKDRCPGRILPLSIKANCQADKELKTNLFGKITRIARKYKKSSIMKLFRNFIWKQGKWNSKELNEWIDKFNPQAVLVMSGKSEYFHDVARIIAQERNIPLVVYHCEDYYFKNTHPYSPFYQYYRYGLKKSLKKLMNYASLAIYNSVSIQKLYQKEFDTPGKVAYMATDMTVGNSRPNNEQFTISYLGNLANKRYESLKIFSEALYEVEPKAKINVYAPPLNATEQKTLDTCSNINFKGMVSYEECKSVMQNSDLLLHIESFEPKVIKDLRIAFSTKIADCLASGVCFFVFAPEGIACTEYIKETKSACLVSDPKLLKDELRKILEDSELKESYVKKALQTVEKNHSKESIGDKVLESISNVCN